MISKNAQSSTSVGFFIVAQLYKFDIRFDWNNIGCNYHLSIIDAYCDLYRKSFQCKMYLILLKYAKDGYLWYLNCTNFLISRIICVIFSRYSWYLLKKLLSKLKLYCILLFWEFMKTTQFKHHYWLDGWFITAALYDIKILRVFAALAKFIDFLFLCLSTNICFLVLHVSRSWKLVKFHVSPALRGSDLLFHGFLIVY